jgi:2-succinyl-6-hydroxy-2,4-cyclohexadiene-1-carboxylate synthase
MTSSGKGLPYSTWGKRDLPAVVFLHGFLGARQDWEDIARELSSQYFCVAMDLPGHGGANQLPASFDSAADALAATLRILQIQSCTLIGYSMGARMALYFASRHPELCESLILESGSPGLETETERSERRKQDELKAQELENTDLREFLRRWYAQPLFATLAKDSTSLELTLQKRLKNDPAGLAASLRGMGTGRQPSLWEKLPEIQPPIHLIVGEQDAKFVGIAMRMTTACKQAWVSVIPGAGHNVHLEAPVAYLQAVRQALNTT